MKATLWFVLCAAFAASLLSAGCYPYSAKAEAVGREYRSVRARTQPDDRLTAQQREKLRRDEDALEGDIADLASGR